MAILPTNEPAVPEEHPTPAVHHQPQPLTVQQYLQRQQKRKEEELTRIPVTKPPKRRRGGKIVKLRRRRADIRNILDSTPPPSWERSSILWLELMEIEKTLRSKKTQNTNKNTDEIM